MITAIVPIKRNSNRTPGKNFVLVNGIPLYHYVFETLSKIDRIQSILVDTDCPEMLTSLLHMHRVKILKRPQHLFGDEIVMNQLLESILTQTEEEHFLQTHVTNPLLSSKTIEEGIDFYFSQLDSYDSLFTVEKIRKRVYHENGIPINHDLSEMKMTQDLSPLCVENSNLFLFSRQSFYANGNNRLGKKPFMMEMDSLEGLDIDEPKDLELAKMVLEYRSRNDTHNLF